MSIYLEHNIVTQVCLHQCVGVKGELHSAVIVWTVSPLHDLK